MFEASTANNEILWTARTPQFDTFVLITLFVSLLLLTFSRLLQESMLKSILVNTFKGYSFRIPINIGAGFFLILNYVIVCLGMTYLVIQDYDLLRNSNWGILFGTTFILILLPFINSVFGILFLGRKEILMESATITKNLIFLKSILYSILLLLWTFNDKWDFYFKQLTILFIFLFFILRIGYLLQKSFKHSIHWYYLILYFCSLEILPYVFIAIILSRFLGIEIIV